MTDPNLILILADHPEAGSNSIRSDPNPDFGLNPTDGELAEHLKLRLR